MTPHPPPHSDDPLDGLLATYWEARAESLQHAIRCPGCQLQLPDCPIALRLKQAEDDVIHALESALEPAR